jgi:hypothetical protein
MQELRDYVSKKAPNYHVLVEEDIIRVVPKA